MEKYQAGVITILLCLSGAAVCVPSLIYGIRKMTERSAGAVNKRTTMSWMLLFSGCLILSVWCLRYAVGYFTIISAAEDVKTLTWWEEIFNSMLHALQTFSMDESYTEYILNGKAMIGDVFGSDSMWETVYGLYASLLNFIAPIAGGAIIFEILTSVFPNIRLRLSYFAIWREKYYFSELNEASVALAKSISGVKGNTFSRPIIIFTKTDSVDNEKGAEMLLEAKQLGAVCVRDSLSYVKKNKLGRRKFFLISEVESENLHILVDLADSGNSKYLKEAEIYLFTNDDAYVQVEKRVKDKLSAELHFSNEELPVFIPIKSYRNLIANLLVDVPLYEPLIKKKRDSDGNQTLTITILGTGCIGTEMFLTTYWLGQILNCSLKINILSQESEDYFWSKIDYVNPEIRHTTIKGDPILRINRKGDIADVYCEVNYCQCDVKSSEFISCLTEPRKDILNTDYFLVSLGSDEDNISVANTIRMYVGQYHINVRESIKTVIAYVVYDDELTNILNRTTFYKTVNDEADIYMQAIGSLRQVYSVRNVFLTVHKPFAEKMFEAYIEMHNREERAKTHRARMDNDYKYWANMARSMHLKYKVYSMGMMSESMFDYPDAVGEYNEVQTKAYAEYKRVVSGQVDFASSSDAQEHLKLLHRMAWLEKRRWNAFTRIKGFRGTKDYDAYAVAGDYNSYKQMDLKLHPCLLECDQKGIRAVISPKGIIDTKSVFQYDKYDDLDLLDDLSYDLYTKKYNNYDFKIYDYPISSL